LIGIITGDSVRRIGGRWPDRTCVVWAQSPEAFDNIYYPYRDE